MKKIGFTAALFVALGLAIAPGASADWMVDAGPACVQDNGITVDHIHVPEGGDCDGSAKDVDTALRTTQDWLVDAGPACVQDGGILIDHIHVPEGADCDGSNSQVGAVVTSQSHDGETYYLQVTADGTQFFEETNGLEGLQIQETEDADGNLIPADERISEEEAVAGLAH